MRGCNSNLSVIKNASLNGHIETWVLILGLVYMSINFTSFPFAKMVPEKSNLLESKLHSDFWRNDSIYIHSPTCNVELQ